MVSIWETVESVKQAIIDAVALIKTKDDDAAKRFTGIAMVSIYIHERRCEIDNLFYLFLSLAYVVVLHATANLECLLPYKESL